MTNEQAQYWLMYVKYKTDNNDLVNEAIDMAIEALQRGLENVNADSCSEKPNRSEPKTADSGSVEKEMPEIKTDRTTGGMIYRQDAIDAVRTIQTYKLFIGDDMILVDKAEVQTELMLLPSAQPELIEKTAYIRGFEHGRTQGMIDAQGEKK